VATGSISENNTTEFVMHRSYDADPTKDRCHSFFYPTEGERLSLPCWLIRYPGSKATHCLRSSELTGLNVKQVLLVCTAPLPLGQIATYINTPIFLFCDLANQFCDESSQHDVYMLCRSQTCIDYCNQLASEARRPQPISTSTRHR